MPIIPGIKESYVGALLENIIYGVYLSMFRECCILFYKKKSQGTLHLYPLATTFLMFIAITMRCIIDTYRCAVAFDNAEVDPGPSNSTLGILGTTCWVVLTIVADMFIVYRAFIVWGRSRPVVIIPSLLVLANMVIGIFGIMALDSNTTLWSPVDWMNALISLTLCTNVICTGLISFQIIRVHRRIAWMASTDSSRDTIRIVSIIVESAAVYTAMLAATLVVARLRGFGIFILVDCLSPTILTQNDFKGLIFSSIIIRVSRGTSVWSTTPE
ncbi:hypothetical protein MVEN_00169900 [Mycena venus]|uniref:Uncharacterized protein n=1 Tax=Mycena venus TaxID=2733690 RepID=A0A8H6Z0N1_9AGAR|nr:hypothetical protein MVEN_00169900 [Mycena venus]